MDVTRKLAIVVCGGPAPGINSVLGAATIRACLSDVEVLGIQDGFRWLVEGDTDHVVPLSIADTSRIHFRGGSHIGISRVSPKTPAEMDVVCEGLRRLGIGRLITIGGDGTAYLAHLLARHAKGALHVVHVPKTIDNDIDLPQDTSTFGFQTARHVGCEIVENLMVDAKTTSRWYFVVAQGRKAGHLALAIGKAAGATLTLIPEEFSAQVRLGALVDILAGAVVKRLAYGRSDGVAMLAEGLADRISLADLERHGEVPRDARGNVAVAQIDLCNILTDLTEQRLASLGVKTSITAKSIGYELRCADPIPFDMDYTRDLGYCAARYIIEGGTEAMVSMVGGRFRPIPFADLIDLKSGRTRVRMVDVASDRYRIARTYMLRLKREDFEDETELDRLATTANLTPEKFREQFAHTVAHEPESFRLSMIPGERRVDPSA